MSSPIAALAALPAVAPTANDVLDGAQTTISAFAADFGPAAVIVLGIAVGIGLGIWGFLKIVRLFKKSAN